MRRILFDVMEINIAVGAVILLVSLFAGRLRKRYGAGWLRAVWILLAVRLLIPYNFSLPNTELRLFNAPGFGQEARMAESRGVMYSDILLCMWLTGAGICAVYHLLVYIHLRRKCVCDLKTVRSMDLQRQIFALQEKYSGGVRLPVYESGLMQSPVLTGLVRPKLIIPSHREKWGARELELVIAHELCHYKKRDLWLKTLVLAASCMNWFNPAVFLLKKQFYWDMEVFCDHCVIGNGSGADRETYARTLLGFAGKNNRNSAFTAGFSTNNKLLRHRIYYIWEDRKKKRGAAIFLLLLILVSGIGLSVSCGYKPQESVCDITSAV